MDLSAHVNQVLSEVRLVGAATSKDTEIAVLKNTLEGQKNTQYLAEKIVADGGETRRLLNEMKYTDLNRELIERNTELNRHHIQHERHNFDPVQFASQMASLQSQVQAIGSQMSDTRQSLVNLGTMVGSGQTSSTNNVR
jgi:primosomal protein N''